MREIDSFYNDGSGWICKQCDRELSSDRHVGEKTPRLFREGEAESKQPKLANAARARWADRTRQVLVCPRCGISEPVDKR